ncbi:hypothetical protein DFJ74DRAFT_734944 [Hyaloraphidium curvatum]|nr:hypothetical protein DFJ74DRAFT_734944 [Hyaloraphidium curvatum]
MVRIAAWSLLACAAALSATLAAASPIAVLDCSWTSPEEFRARPPVSLYIPEGTVMWNASKTDAENLAFQRAFCEEQGYCFDNRSPGAWCYRGVTRTVTSTTSTSASATPTVSTTRSAVCTWTATSQIRVATGVSFPAWNPALNGDENIAAQRAACISAGHCFDQRAPAWCYQAIGYATITVAPPTITTTASVSTSAAPICTWTATSQIRVATGVSFPPWNPALNGDENIAAQRAACISAGHCFDQRAPAWCYQAIGFTTVTVSPPTTTTTSRVSAITTTTASVSTSAAPICTWTATSQIRVATGVQFPAWNPALSNDANIAAQRAACINAGHCFDQRSPAWCFQALGFTTVTVNTSRTTSTTTSTLKDCSATNPALPAPLQFPPWDKTRTTAWNLDNQRSLCTVKGFCFDQSIQGPWCYLPRGWVAPTSSSRSTTLAAGTSSTSATSTSPRLILLPTSSSIATTSRTTSVVTSGTSRTISVPTGIPPNWQAPGNNFTSTCGIPEGMQIQELLPLIHVPQDSCRNGSIDFGTAREACTRQSFCWIGGDVGLCFRPPTGPNQGCQNCTGSEHRPGNGTNGGGEMDGPSRMLYVASVPDVRNASIEAALCIGASAPENRVSLTSCLSAGALRIDRDRETGQIKNATGDANTCITHTGNGALGWRPCGGDAQRFGVFDVANATAQMPRGAGSARYEGIRSNVASPVCVAVVPPAAAGAVVALQPCSAINQAQWFAPVPSTGFGAPLSG